MRKSVVSWASVAALFLVFTAMVMADEKVDLKGVKCVLNCKGDAKATSSADYKGGKVYFCCDDCKDKFTKEPKEYAAAANAQLVATKQAKQVKCPITGKDVKEGVTVKVRGVEIGVCCAGCQKKLTDMEEKDQLETAFGEKAFEKSFELAKKDAKKKDTQ
ncbi:MAG: YHS domain-containing protein [Pirellulaceae bacterium]